MDEYGIDMDVGYKYIYLFKGDIDDSDSVGFLSDKDMGDEGDTILVFIEIKEAEISLSYGYSEETEKAYATVGIWSYKDLTITAPCCSCLFLSTAGLVVGIVLLVLAATGKKEHREGGITPREKRERPESYDTDYDDYEEDDKEYW